MNTLSVSTKYRDIEIREGELSTITKSDLKKLGISRKDLLRCFAEGIELMKGTKPGDRVRPIAAERVEGVWVVILCRYSAWSDPLMQGDGEHRQ